MPVRPGIAARISRASSTVTHCSPRYADEVRQPARGVRRQLQELDQPGAGVDGRRAVLVHGHDAAGRGVLEGAPVQGGRGARGSTVARGVARRVVGVPLDPAVVAPARQPRRARPRRATARSTPRRSARRRARGRPAPRRPRRRAPRAWAGGPRASAARPSRSRAPGPSAGPAPRAARCTASRASASECTPPAGDRSMLSSASPVSRTWTCASTNAGGDQRAVEVDHLVGARHARPSAVSSAPIQTTVPSSTRSASAKGSAAEWTTPCRYRVELTGAHDRAGQPGRARRTGRAARVDGRHVRPTSTPPPRAAGRRPPAGGVPQPLVRRRLGQLVEHVDDLLAPPHEVARGQLAALEHRVEAAPGGPPVHGLDQPERRAAAMVSTLCAVSRSSSSDHARTRRVERHARAGCSDRRGCAARPGRRGATGTRASRPPRRGPGRRARRRRRGAGTRRAAGRSRRRAGAATVRRP